MTWTTGGHTYCPLLSFMLALIFFINVSSYAVFSAGTPSTYYLLT